MAGSLSLDFTALGFLPYTKPTFWPTVIAAVSRLRTRIALPSMPANTSAVVEATFPGAGHVTSFASSKSWANSGKIATMTNQITGEAWCRKRKRQI
jgi:hypothetical protein